MKKCSLCKVEKPFTDFYKARTSRNIGRVHGWCKDCTKERARASQLKSKYGISLEQYETMLQEQGSRCAICGTDVPAMGWVNFPVDHDHETGSTRGLLCNTCNIGLGAFKDSPFLLESAIVYLSRHSIEENRRRAHQTGTPST